MPECTSDRILEERGLGWTGELVTGKEDTGGGEGGWEYRGVGWVRSRFQ